MMGGKVMTHAQVLEILLEMDSPIKFIEVTIQPKLSLLQRGWCTFFGSPQWMQRVGG